jgi:hypothetical protein
LNKLDKKSGVSRVKLIIVDITVLQDDCFQVWQLVYLPAISFPAEITDIVLSFSNNY